MMGSLCSIRVIDFCNRCFDTWLGVANSFYWVIVAGHLSLDCGAVVETFKPTVDNNIEYFSRSLASNNSSWSLNSDFDKNQIWCGNRRIFIENFSRTHDSKVLFFIFICTDISDRFFVVKFCNHYHQSVSWI